MNGDFLEEEKRVSESRRQLRPSVSSSSTPRESKWGSFIRKALLAFRVTAFLSCLVSFSVMVADRDKGWARDSFYNYKEFRFCVAATVIGFVYSGFMICDLVHLLSTSIRRSRGISWNLVLINFYFSFDPSRRLAIKLGGRQVPRLS